MSPATSSIGIPRVLLRRLHEVMAEKASTQDRLDRIVRMIASSMVAEVCSIYLVTRADELELVATEGLNPDAVHKTRLRVGEGLVGLIAKTADPLNLPDAQDHPNFAYRPETGEDPYRSLMGVPILRNGETLGVLVVQNKTSRNYAEEEVEALQTIALVLSEIVVSGELVDPAIIQGIAPRPDMPHTIKGIALAPGLAMGEVVLHEPKVRIERIIADDEEAELTRLDRGVEDLRTAVDALLDGSAQMLTGAPREVLEAYRMFAHDRGWLSRLREAVRTGLTAEAAVERVQNDTRARMMRQRDSYLRERLHDLDDLSNRLLRHLTGQTGKALTQHLPDTAIVIARNMGPAELLDYDRARLKGLVLEEGSQTAHVSIVARALDIPMVGSAGGILERAENGDRIIVDGDSGEVHLRPGPDLVHAYESRLTLARQRRAQFDALRHQPAVTVDGVRAELLINAGLLVDLPHLEETGADGIGLFRTELQFMVSSTMPRLEAQTELYRRVLETAGERRVVFRTLDLGGDKVLPYGAAVQEENPALGWRAVRIALDRPALLRYQMRALLRAAEGRDLWVMFPMIAEVPEFIAARQLVDMEVERAQRRGQTMPRSIRVGTMLEVPSLAWQLDQLMPLTDFISVGSNDLMQFLFASDRGNPRLSGRYDILSPPVFSFLRHLVAKAEHYGVHVSLCGEAAGRPLDAMALLGLGLRSISMPAASVGPVKLMVRSLHMEALGSRLEELEGLSDHSLRPHLEAFARDHGIML
jgi:phosphotransferase system enzyme I (PtsP)